MLSRIFLTFQIPVPGKTAADHGLGADSWKSRKQSSGKFLLFHFYLGKTEMQSVVHGVNTIFHSVNTIFHAVNTIFHGVKHSFLFAFRMITLSFSEVWSWLFRILQPVCPGFPPNGKGRHAIKAADWSLWHCRDIEYIILILV